MVLSQIKHQSTNISAVGIDATTFFLSHSKDFLDFFCIFSDFLRLEKILAWWSNSNAEFGFSTSKCILVIIKVLFFCCVHVLSYFTYRLSMHRCCPCFKILGSASFKTFFRIFLRIFERRSVSESTPMSRVLRILSFSDGSISNYYIFIFPACKRGLC